MGGPQGLVLESSCPQGVRSCHARVDGQTPCARPLSGTVSGSRGLTHPVCSDTRGARGMAGRGRTTGPLLTLHHQRPPASHGPASEGAGTLARPPGWPSQPPAQPGHSPVTGEPARGQAAGVASTVHNLTCPENNVPHVAQPKPHRLGGRLGTLHGAKARAESSTLSPPPNSTLLELPPRQPASPPPLSQQPLAASCPRGPHPHVLPASEPLVNFHCSPDTSWIPLVSLIPSLTHQNPTSTNTQASAQGAPRVTAETQAIVPHGPR